MSDNFAFFDTHCHLLSEQFAPDRADVIERMHQAGVTRTLEIGYNLASSHAAIIRAQHDAGCWAVVGIQPNYAEEFARTDWHTTLEGMVTQPGVVAVGEIGFDHFHNKAPVATQEALFRAQIALARQYALPIVIHSRDAHADTLRVLQDEAYPHGVVLHSFAGDVAYAQACLDIGCTLSFSGPITFKNNRTMHDVVAMTPLDRMLIETDSPYLAPHPYRGKRNEPTYVVEVARQIAHLKGCSVAEVARHTWRNAVRVFKLEE